MSGIKLGDEVRCRVTGFQGYATARVEYLNGTSEVSVTPPTGNKAEYPKSQYIDESRLEATGKTLNFDPPQPSAGFSFDRTGGES